MSYCTRTRDGGKVCHLGCREQGGHVSILLDKRVTREHWWCGGLNPPWLDYTSLAVAVEMLDLVKPVFNCVIEGGK